MNAKQIGLGIILADFVVLNAWVIYQYGYIGFFTAMLANIATIAVFVDLTIALSLIAFWMWQDAHKRGVAFLPYFLLTLTFGSVGPLLYLIRHAGSEATRSHALTPKREPAVS
jgi:fatty acid desaturase